VARKRSILQHNILTFIRRWHSNGASQTNIDNSMGELSELCKTNEMPAVVTKQASTITGGLSL